MIKLEHLVTASPEQMEFIIEGMRNPMNSWEKSDSGYLEECPYQSNGCYDKEWCDMGCPHADWDEEWVIGNNDISLMQKLAKAGTDHRKFMRMMPVYVRITAPLYWWKEFDTYKVGTVANSCSTMHKITAKEFDISDFSFEKLTDPTMDNKDWVYLTISRLNEYRDLYLQTKDKIYWWQIIQLLPSSYNQIRNVTMNYEVLANIYKSRKDHKLDEWREFCKWIETDIPYNKLITGFKSVEPTQGEEDV